MSDTDYSGGIRHEEIKCNRQGIMGIVSYSAVPHLRVMGAGKESLIFGETSEDVINRCLLTTLDRMQTA